MISLPYQRAFHRIRIEVLDAPHGRLTPMQVSALSAVCPVVCRQVLDDLVRARFLRMDASGAYARRTDVVPVGPRAVA